jgi:hypothetical protein
MLALVNTAPCLQNQNVALGLHAAGQHIGAHLHEVMTYRALGEQAEVPYPCSSWLITARPTKLGHFPSPHSHSIWAIGQPSTHRVGAVPFDAQRVPLEECEESRGRAEFE